MENDNYLQQIAYVFVFVIWRKNKIFSRIGIRWFLGRRRGKVFIRKDKLIIRNIFRKFRKIGLIRKLLPKNIKILLPLAPHLPWSRNSKKNMKKYGKLSHKKVHPLIITFFLSRSTTLNPQRDLLRAVHQKNNQKISDSAP